MKYEVKFTSRFKKDVKRIQKNPKDIFRFRQAVEMLANGMSLPEEFHDHKLIGNFDGARECHIKPNLLLVYKIYDDILVLQLMRIGSHSEIF